MGPETLRRLRWLLPACAGIVCAILVSVLGQSPGRAAGVPLSIAVEGNHFVNGSGQTVRLLVASAASMWPSLYPQPARRPIHSTPPGCT